MLLDQEIEAIGSVVESLENTLTECRRDKNEKRSNRSEQSAQCVKIRHRERRKDAKWSVRKIEFST